MSIELKTAEWLRGFVEERMAHEAEESEQARAWTATAGGMLLYGTIGHEAYLRSDGSVWIYHDRGGEAVNEWVWSQATGVERIGSLVIASERISELRRLLPTRHARMERRRPLRHGCGERG